MSNSIIFKAEPHSPDWRYIAEKIIDGYNWKVHIIGEKTLFGFECMSLNGESGKFPCKAQIDFYISKNANENKQTYWPLLISYEFDLIKTVVNTFESDGAHFDPGVDGSKVTKSSIIKVDISVLNAPSSNDSYAHFLKKDSESDLTLVIEDQEIFVHKSLLIGHSDYFKAMFTSGFKEKDENRIVLEELKLDEFLQLLCIIYPLKFRLISDSDVDVIAKMAARFGCQRILELCQKFYMIESKMSHYEKFMVVTKYNFSDLKNHVMDSIKTMEELKNFQSNLNIEELSDANKIMIFKKFDEIVKLQK